MGIEYDKDKVETLESDIQSLEESFADTSKAIAEFDEKDMSEGSNMSDRNELLAKHGVLTNQITVMKGQLNDMLMRRPPEALPDSGKMEPEIEALDAMLRKEGTGNDKMEVSLDALLKYQESRMIARSDVSTNADGAAGGATTVHTQPTLVDSLKAFGAGLNVIPIIETPDGNEMKWPVTDQTSLTGRMLADEGTTITSADPKAITNKVLSTKRFTSDFIPVSNTLVQDSVFDIISFATNLATQKIGRAISGKIITATNSADGIDGFKSMATQIAAPTTQKKTFNVIEDSVRLIHGINRAYISSEGGWGGKVAGSGLNNQGGFVGFLVSYDAMRLLRVAKDAENRPLWSPSIRVGWPDMLMGYPVMVVDEMDSFQADAESVTGNMPVMFGNWTYFQGRFAKNLTIERFYDSHTAETDSTWFSGIARFGMRSIVTDVSSKNPAVAAWTLA